MADRMARKNFRPGEGCAQCRAKWYQTDSETGRRYCANGHQIEGWVQYDVAEEDTAPGFSGEITRKKVDRVKDRPTDPKRLTGAPARTLYLECFQIMLRKVVRWIIIERNHPSRLEDVVKDLWDLRIRGCPDEEEEEETESHVPDGDQAEEDEVDGEPEWTYKDHTWSSKLGSKWPVPNMDELLCLCYFGCVLLRVPTTIGDMMRWVDKGHIPLKTMYNELPKAAHERLPLARILAMRRLVNMGTELNKVHYKSMDLALAYDLNYGMKMPELNYLPILIQYGKNLGLPLELVQVVRTIIHQMELKFSFPQRLPRIRIISHPEVCLIAAVVVATKLYLPFPLGKDKKAPLPWKASFPRMDWHKWNELMAPPQPSPSSADRQSIDAISISQVNGQRLADADDAALDEFLDRVLAEDDRTTTSHTNDETDELKNVRAFFPLDAPRPTLLPLPVDEESQPEGTDDQEQLAKLRRVQLEAVCFPTEKEVEDADPAKLYPAWRTVEELPAIAKSFYQLAASQAGLSLEMLVKVADNFEVRFERWQETGRTGRTGSDG